MIGQKQIQAFVKNLIVEEKIPTEINLLLVGKAGIGKTHAIRYIYNTLSNHPDLRDCIEHHPKYTNPYYLEKFSNVPIHIVDEVHLVEYFESLYPYMEKHLFLTATNLPESLPEAFRTRCITLVMENYSKQELGLIVQEEYNLTNAQTQNLVERSRGTPRDILQMASLININPNTDLEELGYLEGGFRHEDRLYIDYLKEVERSSSLSRICAATNLDKTTVQTFVEPFLLEKGLIKITNRRHLITDE